MSYITCPYDVGAPSDWLSSASLPADAKACAVPVTDGCNDGNTNILNDCCAKAAQSTSDTAETTTWSNDSTAVCSLPATVSNQTYQQFQDCILTTPGRSGGFRCNDQSSYNTGEHCNSLNGVINPPIPVPADSQVCVTGARANTSSLMHNCCQNDPVSFEGGCWQYCVGPADSDVGACISAGLNAMNITASNVGCISSRDSSVSASSDAASSATPTGSLLSTSTSTNAASPNEAGVGLSLGLVAVMARVLGVL